MKKIIDKFKWLQLLFGVIMVALGVLTIVLAINIKDDFEKTVLIVWAAALFLIAFTIILFDFIAFYDKAEFSGLIASGLCVGIGVFVLINKSEISTIITTLLPYVLISIGGVLLLKTIVLAIRRISFKQWLLPFILAITFITSGIVFLVVKEGKVAIYIVLGILFVVLGGVETVGFITVLANKKSANTNVPATTTKKKKDKTEEPVQEIEAEKEVIDATPKQIEQEDDIKLID